MAENGWKNILISLPVKVHEKLKDISQATGTPMTQIIRNAILEFLKKMEQQEKEVRK